jgi:hypothetical protein
MSVTTFAPDFGDDKAGPIDHSKKHPATSKGKSESYYNHSKCSARSFRFAGLASGVHQTYTGAK